MLASFKLLALVFACVIVSPVNGFVESIIEGLFGGSGGGGDMMQQQMHHHHGRQRTPDALIELGVSLDDLYNGVTKSISYQRHVVCNHCHGTGAEGGETRKCSKCNGQGHIMVEQQVMPGFRMQSQKTCPKCGGKGHIYKHKCRHCNGDGIHTEETHLDVKIEKGFRSGHDIRFQHKAEERPGFDTGDAIIRLVQEPHSYFNRDGDNLRTAVEISLTQALLGFDLNIQHMDKRWVNLKHDKVSTYGEVRKYEKEGMPHHGRGSKFGDLLVEYRVSFPDTITDSQKNTLLELFSDESIEGEMP